nr:MAG TPA: hypothetical protein [Caudoviricetes sp.]
MTYSKNIVRLRQERNLSQEEVADAIGVTPAAVCGWERGNKQMSIANLICLADLFLVSTDEILGRRDYEH